MDGFNRVRGCGAAQRFGCYVQYQPSDIPNFAAWLGISSSLTILESNGVPELGVAP